MYLRHTIRKKDGKVHRYWCLVRGVRVGRRVIQQTVAHLGELDERGRSEARALARHLIGTPKETQLFDDGCRHVAVPVRLKWDLMIYASICWRLVGNAFPGRRRRPCWLRHGSVSRRVNCTLPRVPPPGAFRFAAARR